MQTMIVF